METFAGDQGAMRLLSIAAALLAASIASLVTTCADARVQALVATAADGGAQGHAAGSRVLLQSSAMPPPVPDE